MKHLSSLLTAALAATLLTACSGKPTPAGRHDATTHRDDRHDKTHHDKAPEAPDDAPLHFAKTTWKEVRMVSKPSCATIDYDLRYADAGPKALVDNINLWVAGQFGLRDGVTPESLPQMVRKEAAARLAEDAVEIKESFGPESDYGYDIQYSRSYTVRIEYTSPEYVTLSAQTYVYSGGAHGNTIAEYATFRLADGRKMDWELLRGMPRTELKRAIRKGLMAFFEVKTEAELLNELLLGPTEDGAQATDIPLPQMPPFLTKKGVEVIYQQYEIACYAAGMPTCVVCPRPMTAK